MCRVERDWRMVWDEVRHETRVCGIEHDGRRVCSVGCGEVRVCVECELVCEACGCQERDAWFVGR